MLSKLSKLSTCLLKPLACLSLLLLAAACASTDDKPTAILEADKTYVLPASPLALAAAYDTKKLSLELRDLQKEGDKPAVESLRLRIAGELVSRDYKAAFQSSKQLVRRLPQDENAKLLLVESLVKGGKLPLAELILSGVKNQNDGRVLNLLGVIHILKNEPALAAGYFQRAKEADSRGTAAAFNLGLLFLEHYKYDAAAMEFDHVLKLDKDHADAKLHKAVVLRQRKKMEEAGRLLEELAEAHHTSPLVYHNLAVFYMERGEYGDAEDAVNQALKNAAAAKADTRKSQTLKDEIKRLAAKD